MKLAIMQPYLFPYIGYFQLIYAVDTFVVYDDVNFIKGGWINRNFILSQGKRNRLTLQLQGASPNLLINQVKVGNNQKKLLKSIQQNYSKAPFFADVFPMLEDIVMRPERNLALYLNDGLKSVCDYLDLRPKWLLSSSLEKNNELRGQEKVLSICKELGASHYINVPGGRELYDHFSFEEQGLKLSFIQPNPSEYQQWDNEFVPSLSVIDALMFNNQTQCHQLLQEYSFD